MGIVGLKDEQTTAQGCECSTKGGQASSTEGWKSASDLCSVHLSRPSFLLFIRSMYFSANFSPAPKALWLLEVSSCLPPTHSLALLLPEASGWPDIITLLSELL